MFSRELGGQFKLVSRVMFFGLFLSTEVSETGELHKWH